jgi:hypothetical protein
VKRFKACLHEKKHETLLKELHQCNDALRDFTHDAITLEPIRVKRFKAKSDHEKWEIVRKLAKSLHDVLEKNWLCDCADAHLAHLRLERSLEPKETDTFAVHFAFASAPTEWLETKIKIERNLKERLDIHSFSGIMIHIY